MSVEKKDERLKMYQRHRKALVDYATPLLGSRDDAEDIVQDTYLRFVPDKADEDLPPKTYLFRIVRNLSFNRRARRKRELSLDLDDIPWWAQPQAFSDPESDLLFSEQIKSAAAAVEDLPDKARAVLMMYRFEDMTLKDIAETLKISIPTAHRLLRDAMERIKKSVRDSA